MVAFVRDGGTSGRRAAHRAGVVRPPKAEVLSPC